jgi:uncharacterized repeat protein (TIGR03943 family)
MRSSPAGMLRTGILTAWAGFLAWMLISGDVYRFIGPRTRWVIVFGLAIVGATMLAQVRAKLAPAREVSGRELIGLASFLAPIAVFVLVPGARLGSEAASRKVGGGFVGSAASFAPTARPGQNVSFPEISFASQSQEYAAAIGIFDGYHVKLTGFVTHPEAGPGGTFALTRFATFCCAADAVPYSVQVDPGKADDYPDDTWLTVSGSLVRSSSGLALRAEEIVRVEEPENPYI